MHRGLTCLLVTVPTLTVTHGFKKTFNVVRSSDRAVHVTVPTLTVTHGFKKTFNIVRSSDRAVHCLTFLKLFSLKAKLCLKPRKYDQLGQYRK